MSVIDDYLATLDGPEKATLERMYNTVRQLVPDAAEELSYAMPAFKYKGKGLVAIMSTRKFLSLYPFGNIENLGLDLSAFEGTKGSIHFTPEKPIPEGLLRKIIEARVRQIDTA